MKDHRRKTHRPLKATAALAVSLSVAAAIAAPADAAEKYRLTIISGNTHHYAPIGAAIKAFIPKVD